MFMIYACIHRRMAGFSEHDDGDGPHLISFSFVSTFNKGNSHHWLGYAHVMLTLKSIFTRCHRMAAINHRPANVVANCGCFIRNTLFLMNFGRVILLGWA